MKYENRIVLFLDILGFQDHLNKTVDKKKDNEDEIQKLYHSLQLINWFAGINDGSNKIATQFSDSLVISFKPDSKNEFLNLLDDIIRLIIALVQNGIICRGAISYGKLIHTKEIIFGPALVDAYLTESKAAMYPRVILDPNILDTVAGSTEFYTDGRPQKKVLLSYLDEDEDGKYFIDYFKQCHYGMLPLENLNAYIDSLRSIIVDGRRKQKPDLKVKYGWMKSKFNKMVDVFTEEKFVSSFGASNGQAEILKLKTLKKI